MANKTYAKEWIVKAYHDLDSANILYNSGHYTDTVGYLYHQAIEKLFKAIIAYENSPITKTHNLIQLHELIDKYFDFNEDDLMLLATITTYCTKQRYPTINQKLPSNDEIKKVKDFSNDIFDNVCNILNINKSELF